MIIAYGDAIVLPRLLQIEIRITYGEDHVPPQTMSSIHHKFKKLHSFCPVMKNFHATATSKSNDRKGGDWYSEGNRGDCHLQLGPPAFEPRILLKDSLLAMPRTHHKGGQYGKKIVADLTDTCLTPMLRSAGVLLEAARYNNLIKHIW